ncbi:radical SAM protein [Streptacidiphilus sp. ASG 303]|uniref:B12-binding domain-containing radical SAM protein n=1 Tax=Streptacidiphilus sp. ASG 303 TaxID=2896847 RepID=UPI001E53985E|nr:radical SAM protein [Streptacidiphilus sp. ASG 303]MCD0484760.1 radical SAM protein [Streptacidiphilus sp. ASG 303]
MNVFVPLVEVGGPSGRKGSDVPYLLVNPPLTDPTTPYHSIPYLVGAAREAGHRAYRCVDANLDAFEYLARPDQFGALVGRARRIRARIGEAASTTRLDEIRYRLALSAEGLTATSAQEAVAVFRDPELFYHPPTYSRAVAVMHRWWDLLSLDMPPGSLDGFSLRTKSGVNLCSTADLSDPAVADAVSRPFEGYLADGFAPLLRERPWGLVGFSVAYTSQLPVALRMARLVRELAPGALVVFGGTEVGDVVKYTDDPDALWRVFRDADVVVPGEGETVLVDLLDAVRDGSGPDGVRGAMTRSAPAAGVAYESVATLPAPAYDVWEWHRYWSPEPVVLYSPTRGCYWNKCTFCDYGLNTDRPTSPSRERPVPVVLDDLREATKHGRVVYFAVDAMSPRYLRRLCAALAESDLGIRWSAELRLERTLPERSVGGLLAASGCVAVSFGYESGSQRILDLIDKGVRIDQVPGVLAELARHGVAAQMMGFTDFPTETGEEARTTYAFLHEHRDLWTTAGIGVFSLTPGSIVAKQPDRFGIELLPPSPSDDIHRYLPWRERGSGAEHWPESSDARIPREHADRIRRGPFDRPFVGGIDSAHSLLYFTRFGRRLWPADRSGEPPRVRLVEETAVTVPFASVDTLTSTDDLLEEMIRRSKGNLDTTAPSFAAWLRGAGGARPGTSGVLLPAQGRPVALPPGLDLSAGSGLGRALRVMAALRSRE